MTGSELPPTLAANPRLSTWITVRSDNVIELRVGKVELGQGIATALVQIAANELGVDPSQLRHQATNTRHSPDEGITAGSMSVVMSGSSVRRACAEVRNRFVRAAARRAGIAPDAVRMNAGRFIDSDGNRIASYGELAAEVDLDVPAGTADFPVEFLGAPDKGNLARIDLPDKIHGRPRFIHDLSFDGMQHARVVRPPGPGRHLLSAPCEHVESLPGITRVVRQGDFLAVIAGREGQAVHAAELLAAGAQWTPAARLPDESALPAWLRAQPAETTRTRNDGADHAEGAGRTTLRASYSKPYLAHGSIGPSCAIASFNGRRLRVWTHSQGVFPLAATIAKTLGLEPARVIVQHVEGAGSYGHNSADDAAFEASLLATLLPDTPIRVLWSREDELRWEPFGPAMTSAVVATLDASGHITDWSYEIWSNGHTARPGYTPAHGLLADAHRAGLDELPVSVDPPLARGHGSARNADPLYNLARVDITVHRLLTMPIRTSSLRSLGSHHNTFAVESFIDELAHAAGRDPLEFRLDHLDDARAKAVLSAAAEAAGWGTPTAEDRGRGIAFCRYKNYGSYCAVVADVEAADTVRVKRLTIAIDVGLVVNEDGVRNQIEGGAIQATSWTLREQVRFNREAITSTDWESYPILRFSEVPQVEVHVLNRPDEPSLGAGEATQGPVPAAIANALFDAIGVRVRTLPLSRDNIVAAIENQ